MKTKEDFELFAWRRSRDDEHRDLRVEKDKFEDVEDGQPLVNYLHEHTRNLNWWEGAFDELSQYRAAENFYVKHRNNPEIQRCEEPSAYIRFCVAKEIIKAKTAAAAAAGAAVPKPGGSRRKRAGTPSSTTSSGTASSSSTSQSGGGSSANRSDSFYSSAPSSSGGGSAGFGGGGGVGGGHIGNEAKRSKPMVVSPKTRR